MAMPPFNEEFSKTAMELFRTAKISPEERGMVEKSARWIWENRSTWQKVAAEIGCPWTWVGIVAVMEGGHSLNRWLANGDPLTGRTRNVPADLSVPGETAPFSWHGAAIVSLRKDGIDKIRDWNVARMLYQFEAWNGSGYRGRGHLSQYVWASTQYEQPGRYVRDWTPEDPGWDANALSDQPGCAALMLVLAEMYGDDIHFPKETVAMDATWLEEYRHPDGEQTIVAWDGRQNPPAQVDFLDKTRDARLQFEFKMKHIGSAKTCLIAPLDKPIPTRAAGPVRPPVVPGFSPAKLVEVACAECRQDISWRGNEKAKKYTKKFEGVFGTGRFSWCAAFVTWCTEQCGVQVPVLVPGDPGKYTFALVEAWQQYAIRKGWWIEGGASVSPRAGDIVIFDWDGATHPDQPSDWEDHIGVVVEDRGSSVYCAEGNVNDATGFKTREKSLIQGYVRIPLGQTALA